MDGDNILTLNFANWITVMIIVIATFALWGLVGRLVHKKMASDGTTVQ